MTAAIPTQLVGSWCKPHWLADHELVYGEEGSWWRVPPELRDEAQDDAVALAVADQLRAGLTVIGDGEQRRQTFSGHFYALGGIDVGDRGMPTVTQFDIADSIEMKPRDPDAPAPSFLQPRVTAPITWQGPIVAQHTDFLRGLTDQPLKTTVIGPVTLALRLVDEVYGSLQTLAFALADALALELQALAAAGVQWIQLDEPEVHFRHSAVADFAAEAIDRAFALVPPGTQTAIHMCYGYAKNIAEKRASDVYAKALALLASTQAQWISLEYAQPGHTPELLEHAGETKVLLGVLDLDTEAPVETVDEIVDRARGAAAVIGADRLGLAPDCGMWFLPRSTARAKITAMAGAARQLRAEL